MNKADKERMYDLKKKNLGAAVGLSFIVTGLGHCYIGEYARGFFILLVQFILWFVLLGWIMWIFAPIDAYKVAKKHNELLRMELGL